MHELSLAENILEIAESYRREHDFTRCNSIVLRLGLLSAVDEETLRFAFETLSEGGLYAQTVLEVERTYPKATCSCGRSFEVRDFCYVCPDCGSAAAELTGRDDLNIVQLEVD